MGRRFTMEELMGDGLEIESILMSDPMASLRSMTKDFTVLVSLYDIFDVLYFKKACLKGAYYSSHRIWLLLNNYHTQ